MPGDWAAPEGDLPALAAAAAGGGLSSATPPRPPVVMGGFAVVPAGLLARMRRRVSAETPRADMITVARNEIMTALNEPDDCILAVVEFLDGGNHRVHYIHRSFRREPDFRVTGMSRNVKELLTKAEETR